MYINSNAAVFAVGPLCLERVSYNTFTTSFRLITSFIRRDIFCTSLWQYSAVMEATLADQPTQILLRSYKFDKLTSLNRYTHALLT